MTDKEIFFVKCDFGKQGQEANIDFQRCAKNEIITDLVAGEFEDVVSVLYMNLAEGTARDVTADIARDCFDKQLNHVESAEDFCDFVKAHHDGYELEFDLAQETPYDRLTAHDYGLQAAE